MNRGGGRGGRDGRGGGAGRGGTRGSDPGILAAVALQDHLSRSLRMPVGRPLVKRTPAASSVAHYVPPAGHPSRVQRRSSGGGSSSTAASPASGRGGGGGHAAASMPRSDQRRRRGEDEAKSKTSTGDAMRLIGGGVGGGVGAKSTTKTSSTTMDDDDDDKGEDEGEEDDEDDATATEKMREAPRPELTLAQRYNLVPRPPELLTERQWAEAHAASKQRAENHTECSICRDEFRADDQVLLSCSHVFHERCIRSFERFAYERCCPICRSAAYQKRRIRDGRVAFRKKAATRIQAWYRGARCRR